MHARSRWPRTRHGDQGRGGGRSGAGPRRLPGPIDSEPDIEVVGEATEARKRSGWHCELLPDVVLMDIRMPDVDGLRPPSASSRTRGRRRACRRGDHLRAGRVRHRGDPGRRERIPGEGHRAGGPVRAVRVAAAGDALLSPTVTRRLLERVADADPCGRLTARAGRPHSARARGPRRGRRRLLQRGDRGSALPLRVDGQDTRVQGHGQAAAPETGPSSWWWPTRRA